MGRLQDDDSTSELMQRYLYKRFTYVRPLREETGRSEGSSEIFSMNCSCESRIGNHPLNMESGIISAGVESSGATDRRYSAPIWILYL